MSNLQASRRPPTSSEIVARQKADAARHAVAVKPTATPPVVVTPDNRTPANGTSTTSRPSSIAGKLRRRRPAAPRRQRPDHRRADPRERPDARIVVLTGYGAIASAVAAVKMGATDYLSKPADANDITGALLARGDDRPEPPENPMSADRVRWEHIQRIYELCDRNVSETARRLNMHRRTLQRILAKRSPK